MLPGGTILATLFLVMIAKLLQVAGLVGLLGLAVAVGVGVFTLHDRVRIVIAPDQAPTVDPIGLLRDDVRGLREEQQQLTQAIRDNFAQLQQVILDQAERQQQERNAAMQNQAQAWAALPKRLDSLDLRLESLERKLGQLALAGAVPPNQVAPSSPAEPTKSAQPPEVSSAEIPSVGKPAGEKASDGNPAGGAPPAPPVAEQPKPANKPSLLGFRLADRKFAFDQTQSFEILGELSRVGFDAKSTLHDFTGVTSKVAGAFTAKLADPASGWSGEISCEAATLVSGVDGRDDAMREHLDTAHHAQIRFAVAGFAPAADGIDNKAQTLRGQVRGTMTIRGKSREVAMPVSIHVDDSKRLVIEGQMPLKLSDYEVPVPNKLGLIKVEDEVNVWIALRARVRSGGSGGSGGK